MSCTLAPRVGIAEESVRSRLGQLVWSTYGANLLVSDVGVEARKLTRRHTCRTAHVARMAAGCKIDTHSAKYSVCSRLTISSSGRSTYSLPRAASCCAQLELYATSHE
eukprot:scaffold287813_cov36-Tisochrysis_lutea.AAC.2